MNCPVCSDVALVMTDRAGIEIDYCPNCRGVWLDRGELDKIIDRSVEDRRAVPAASPSSPPPRAEAPRWDDDRDDDRHHRAPDGKRKKRSMLGELFDF